MRASSRPSASATSSPTWGGVPGWDGPFTAPPGAPSAVAAREKIGLAEIAGMIVLIDRLLAAQVDAILHHPRLQRLEALWRGVHHLVCRVQPENAVEIRILHWTWHELCRDLASAIEFDQSRLFGLVYTAEFGMPGGKPFGVIVGDYAVLHRPRDDHPTDDVSALVGLSQVAAAAFVPVVLTCDPAFLGVGSFGELALHSVTDLFRQDDYQRWRRFQETPDSRFIALVVPRLLMRRPYRDDGVERHGFRYDEDAGEPNGRHHLWGHAGFALAAVLIRAFLNRGWFADIAGVHRDDLSVGGVVAGLPTDSFTTDRPGAIVKPMTEVTLTAERVQELDEQGIVVLSPCKDTRLAAFNGLPAVHRPQRYMSEEATTNARLASRLQYLFCVSRFAHYIKVITREQLGGFTTPEACAARLSQWIANYKTTKTNASAIERALAPLQDAAIRVTEVPGQPGALACTFWLRPHFQPADVVSSFRIVTEVVEKPKG